MEIVVHPAAQRELDAALDWSESTFGRHLAEQLLQRYVKSGRVLMRHPAIGAPAAAGTRKLRLGRFPYSLVYRVTGQLITVVAVAHQSRQPGYWRAR